MLNLTYDDDHLPLHGQLHKKHLQDFFKRLRKAGFKFRYVASGEYGETNRRPHFHIALFGEDFEKSRKQFGKARGGDPTFTSEVVSKYWSFGNHLICTLNFDSCAYIARYIMKKLIGGASPLPLAYLADGEIVMPNPEFMVMSKGIGKTWFNEYFMTDVFPRGSVVTRKGTAAPVPRYYKSLLKEVGQDLALDMRFRTEVRAEAHLERTRHENQPHRKIARDTVNRSRLSLSKRTL